MSAKKSTSKAKSTKASGGPLPPYGVPINEAIAAGNLRNMKAMAVRTRKHIAEVGQALRTLEAAIKKLGG